MYRKKNYADYNIHCLWYPEEKYKWCYNHDATLGGTLLLDLEQCVVGPQREGEVAIKAQ